MGLLDELQEEARELEDQRGVAAAAGRAKAAIGEERLRPRMMASYRYFEKLIESLRELSPQVEMYCELPGFGRVGVLSPSEYRIWLHTPDEFAAFTYKIAESVRKTLKAENVRCTIQVLGRR